MEIKSILQLLESGLSQREIAERLGISYGRVKYLIAKHRKNTNGSSAEADPEMLVEDYTAINESYGTDRLTAMARDSVSLYVYWEMTDARRRMAEEHFGCSWGQLPLRLRIYDVTYLDFKGDHANHYRDIEIRHDANNWFVYELMPGSAYVVDLGTTSIDGRFLTLLRSNNVKLPPREAHRPGEPRYVRVESAAQELPPVWQLSFTGYSLSS